MDGAADNSAEINGSDDDLRPTDTPQQTEPQQAGSSNSPPTDPMANMMQLLTQLIAQLPASMAAAVKVDKPHLDNAKLDHRNFVRIQNFTKSTDISYHA